MLDSIEEARKTLSILKSRLGRGQEHAGAEVANAIDALLQVLEIADAADKHDQVLAPAEITDMGEQGLMLIDNLVLKLASQQRESEKQDVEQVALVIARWVIAHQGMLTNIQSIVNGLACLANAVQDKASLSRLATVMNQIAQACSDEIKHDLDNTNPSRPWRILNINCGIVATRSNDLDLMRVVFPGLIQAIPLDAPGFFEEGMSEMSRLNYPEPVRELMQEFYDRTKLPAVH
ncbi:MAG: hypothetical protein ACC641_05080 [Acidiferrobacterales bacterium]